MTGAELAVIDCGEITVDGEPTWLLRVRHEEGGPLIERVLLPSRYTTRQRILLTAPANELDLIQAAFRGEL